MSAVEDFALSVDAVKRHPGVTKLNWSHSTSDLIPLLEAVRDAWAQAEAVPVSENESRRWSPVCAAAEALIARLPHNYRDSFPVAVDEAVT